MTEEQKAIIRWGENLIRMQKELIKLALIVEGLQARILMLEKMK